MSFSSLNILTDNKKHTPIYRQIGMQLKEYILQNQIKPGTKLPNLLSLAETCGVSIRTMERSLQVLINDKICIRRPKKGTFVNELNLQRSNESCRKVCGILNSDPNTDFATNHVAGPIYQGMQEQARYLQTDLLTLTHESLDFYYHSGDIELVGVILLHWRNLDTIYELVAKYPDLYFIFVNYDPGNLEETKQNIHAVLNDDFAGAYEVGDALVQRGHKNLAIFTAPLLDVNYFQRENGFRQALSMYDIAWNDDRVYACNEILNPNENDLALIGRKSMEQLLTEQPEVTAVFCVNDLIASGAVELLKERRLREQIEVVGYDNILPNVSKDQRFTTVSVDFKSMGSTAIKFMSNKSGYFPKNIRISPKLIPRWYN